MEMKVDTNLFSCYDKASHGSEKKERNKRYTVFIPGPPNCGKTRAARDIILGLFPPDVVVYLFSPQKQERSFQVDADVRRVALVPDKLKKVTIESLRENAGPHPIVCLFDDVDLIRGKVQQAIQELMTELLANGRSHSDDQEHIHMIITNHALNDYRKTKYSIENSEYFVLFPRMTPYIQLMRLLEKTGASPQEIDFIHKLNTRRVLYHAHHPRFIKKLESFK